MPVVRVDEWDEEAPSPSQIIELFTQIQSGKITKVRLQTFLNGLAYPGDEIGCRQCGSKLTQVGKFAKCQRCGWERPNDA